MSRPRRPRRDRPSRRAPFRAPAGLLLAGLLLAGCSGGSGNGGNGGQRGGSGFVAGDGDSTITLIEPDRRQAPVDLSGKTLEGERLDVASLRGAPVVLNVWGSWCGPCRKEAPALEEAARRLEADDVSFVGINTRDEDTAQALAFQRTFEVSYPSLVDSGGSLLLSLRGAVAPNAIPTTLILDDQGRVAARITGPTTETTLVDLVGSVASGDPGGTS